MQTSKDCLLEKIEKEIDERDYQLQFILKDVIKGLLSSKIWNSRNSEREVLIESDIDTLIEEIFVNTSETAQMKKGTLFLNQPSSYRKLLAG